MPAVTLTAIKDIAFDRQFQIQNYANVPIGVDSVKILNYADPTTEMAGVKGVAGSTISAGGLGYSRIDGTISTPDVYSGWVEVFTTEGTKFAPLTINVSLGDPQLLIKIQNLNASTNSLALSMTCPPSSTSKNTLQDCNDLSAIRVLINQAVNSYNQGDITTASNYYSQAQSKYSSLSTTVTCEKSGCGIPLVYFVVVGVIVVVVAMRSEAPTEREGEGGSEEREEQDENYDELPEV